MTGQGAILRLVRLDFLFRLYKNRWQVELFFKSDDKSGT